MAGRREVLGTWDDVFASVEPAHGLLAQEARDLILRLHPASVMTARPGDRAVTFGFGPRKMTDGYVYLMPQRTSVNLGFYQGALLPDPSLGSTKHPIAHPADDEDLPWTAEISFAPVPLRPPPPPRPKR